MISSSPSNGSDCSNIREGSATQGSLEASVVHGSGLLIRRVCLATDVLGTNVEVDTPD